MRLSVTRDALRASQMRAGSDIVPSGCFRRPRLSRRDLALHMAKGPLLAKHSRAREEAGVRAIDDNQVITIIQ